MRAKKCNLFLIGPAVLHSLGPELLLGLGLNWVGPAHLHLISDG